MRLKSAATAAVFLILSIIILLSGCATPEKDADTSGQLTPERDSTVIERPEEDALTYIETLIDEGNSESAVREFEKINNDDPETVIAYAGLLMASGDYKGAEDALVELISRDPLNADAFFNLALVKGLQGDEAAEIENLDKAIAASPDHSEALSVRGSIYLSESKLKKASAMFEKALEADPDNIIALTGYGSALARQEEYEEAEQYLDRAVELDPDNPFTYLDRSSVRAANGDMQGADDDLSAAIELEPGYFWHYLDRGRLRVRNLGDLEGALEDFNRAIEIDPAIFYPYVFRAGIYDDLDKLEEAAADYKTVIEKKPDYYFAYPALGVIQFMLEDWDGARRSFEKAFRYQKDEYAYVAMAALAEMKKEKGREFKAYLAKAMDKVPTNDLYYHLLRAFGEQGYDAYVLRLLKEEEPAIQKRILFYIAELYHESGMETAAYSYFTVVRDAADFGFFESRLAAFELEKYYE